MWGLDVRPDGKGLATGGADKEVKFWEFEMVEGTVRVLFFVCFLCLSMYMDRAGAGVATPLVSDAMQFFPSTCICFFPIAYIYILTHTHTHTHTHTYTPPIKPKKNTKGGRGRRQQQRWGRGAAGPGAHTDTQAGRRRLGASLLPHAGPGQVRTCFCRGWRGGETVDFV